MADELYSSDELADVAAITEAGVSYIVAIDHTYEPAGVTSRHPVEKSGWRLWRHEVRGDEATFHKLPEVTVPLPVPQGIALAMAGDSLAGIVEANNVTPAWLMLWKLSQSGIADLAAVMPHSVPLHLEVAQVTQIHIPSRADWSSPFLPSPLWLFHARLSVMTGNGHILAALNTADAHAIVFEYKPGDPAPKSIAFVANALEPALVNSGQKNVLFYRKPTPEWSVYLHDVTLSGKYGPVALPLEMAGLGGAGGLEHAERLGVDDVFVYGILQAADGRIALATVVGSTQKPELRLQAADKPGSEFHLRQTIPLSHVPFRISMTEDKQGILMALGFLGEGGGFRVETLYMKNE